MDTLLSSELSLILQIREILPNAVGIFEFLTSLGGEMFFLALMPLVYWCLDRRTGAHLTALFLISSYTNSVAKQLFQSPRPFDLAPDQIEPLFGVPIEEAIEAYEAHGNGFPSGHTQSTIVVWGYLASRGRHIRGQLGSLRPLIAAIAALLVVLVPLSRVYLAVHFPRDLAGGYALGLILLALYAWLTPRAGRGLAGMSLKGQLVIAALIPWIAALVVPDKNAVTASATLLGMGVGFSLERRWVGFETEGTMWHRALRYGLGIVVLGALYAGLKLAFAGLEPLLVFRFIRYVMVGLWGSLGAPWAFTELGLAERKR